MAAMVWADAARTGAPILLQALRVAQRWAVRWETVAFLPVTSKILDFAMDASKASHGDMLLSRVETIRREPRS
jgi:hypothetical protein